MKLLKEIFNLSITKEFISVCENIAKQNPLVINNGIGVNFSKSEIESIKFYYGFHHKLSIIDVKNLHLFGSTDTFFKTEKFQNHCHFNWRSDFVSFGF